MDQLLPTLPSAEWIQKQIKHLAGALKGGKVDRDYVDTVDLMMNLFDAVEDGSETEIRCLIAKLADHQAHLCQQYAIPGTQAPFIAGEIKNYWLDPLEEWQKEHS